MLSGCDVMRAHRGGCAVWWLEERGRERGIAEVGREMCGHVVVTRQYLHVSNIHPSSSIHRYIYLPTYLSPLRFNDPSIHLVYLC